MDVRGVARTVALPPHGLTITYQELASMPVEELEKRLDEMLDEHNRQAEQVLNMIMAELFREPVMQFAGKMENFLNHERHRQRQWGKWRRRQARKQNRRRN